jgi:hypothetical protein
VAHGGVRRREHAVFSDDLQQAGLAAGVEDRLVHVGEAHL